MIDADSASSAAQRFVDGRIAGHPEIRSHWYERIDSVKLATCPEGPGGRLVFIVGVARTKRPGLGRGNWLWMVDVTVDAESGTVVGYRDHGVVRI